MKEEKLKQCDILKKCPLNIMQYAFELGIWIRKNPKKYFNNYEARAWQDFDYWPERIFTNRLRLVMPEECLLIDRKFEGEVWFVICRISKSKDIKRVSHLYPVVKLSDLAYFRSGYFLLPKL